MKPRLQPNQPANQAHAHTSDRQDHKGKNQGVTGNSPDIAGDPGHAFGNHTSYIGKDSGNGSSRRTCPKHSFHIL